MSFKGINHRSFERSCSIANGYLKKQGSGRGSIGSEILEKISEKYLDLSLTWLITGKGAMLQDGYAGGAASDQLVNEDKPSYITDEKTVTLLREKILILENSLTDKEKIIRLIEGQLSLRHA